MKIIATSQTIIGSSLTFSALGGRGKEKNLLKPAEKIGGARKKEIVKRILLGGERQRAAAGQISSVQNRFGFGRIIAPRFDFQEFGRPEPRRVVPRQRETLARRARRGSPSAGSKSLAILSICFAQLKLTKQFYE